MASPRILAIRREKAIKALQNKLEGMGVVMRPFPTRNRDKDMLRTMQIEWFADAVDSIPTVKRKRKTSQ